LEALFANSHKTPFPFHFHPTFNITLIYNGTFSTQLSDKLVNAPSGSILITNPREIHANPCDKSGETSFFTFYVSEGFMEYCYNGLPLVFHQKVIYDADLFIALHKLSTQIDRIEERKIFEHDLKNTLRQLCTKYGSGSNKAESHQMITLFEDFLTERRSEKFSLTDAAKRYGIDKYKFLRLFKYQTGLTPNNYFILQRIEKSKQMLSAGHDLLSVAIDLGFYDTAHYCNHFKKFTGISPMAYTTSRLVAT